MWPHFRRSILLSVINRSQDFIETWIRVKCVESSAKQLLNNLWLVLEVITEWKASKTNVFRLESPSNDRPISHYLIGYLLKINANIWLSFGSEGEESEKYFFSWFKPTIEWRTDDLQHVCDCRHVIEFSVGGSATDRELRQSVRHLHSMLCRGYGPMFGSSIRLPGIPWNRRRSELLYWCSLMFWVTPVICLLITTD